MIRVRGALEAALHAQPDPMWLVEPDGTVGLINPAGHALLGGRSPASWEGDLRSESGHPLARAERPTARAAAGALTDQTLALETGEPRRWLEVRVRRLDTGGGIVLVRDITEQRRTKQRIEALNAQLQRHLEQKGRLLARVEAAATLKQRFLDAVSHELRTPLTPIKGFARLLLRGRRAPLSPDQRQMVEVIHNSAERLEGLVNRILDFQVAQGSMLDIDPRPCDLHHLLERLLEHGQGAIADRPVRLIPPDTADLPQWLVTDERHVEPALRQLIDNASRYTPAGTIHVEARWRAADEQLIIAVTDTGIGIAPEHLEFVFSPFFQVTPGHANAAGSVGLGLAHARAMIEAMGGRLTVSSQLGRGSCFTVRLPAPLPLYRARRAPPSVARGATPVERARRI